VDDGFVDSDGDGLADCVDPDDDNDGSPDDADCAPLDPGAFLAPPEEVRDLHWGESDGGRTLLFWTDQGSGMRYDLAGGTVSSLLADRSTLGAACIAADLAVPQFDDARPDPPAGEAYYYVVRSGKIGCGFGTYGFESSGEERQLPNACPPAGPGRPDIDVAPASVDFGDVRAGQSASQQVTVRNVGSAALHVSGLTLSGAAAFNLVDAPATPLTLDSGARLVLTLSYGPSGPGTDSGTLEIDSDDGEEPTTLVPLAGRGVAPLLEVQPASIDFGPIGVGIQADRTVSVRNAGNADLTLQAPSLAAGSSPFFSVGSPGSTLLPPTASTTFIVSFKPGSEGPAAGSVLVGSDGGTFSLPLSGLGVTGATVVSLALNRAGLSLAQGDCFQLRAVATLSDATTQDVTQSALWSALDPAVASVGNGGLVLAMGRGGTTVSASFSGFSAAAAVDIVDPGTLRLALPCGEFVSGSTFDAEVRIDAGPRPLGAYALLITYDPAVVSIGGIGGGSSAPF
ncbi:MAG TPA: choice-of-anchor D domain-containing protein, partial [Actinomycetota bacterium]|nr:choice-of-anchor D domain-containing protein [Actinomycetota bacterium]